MQSVVFLYDSVITLTSKPKQMGIVHRDLKPENILCVERNSFKKIKIADFGMSNVLVKDQNAPIKATSFTAPEILRGRSYAHSLRNDYWSIGVIMYILLCGYPPFYGDYGPEV